MKFHIGKVISVICPEVAPIASIVDTTVDTDNHSVSYSVNPEDKAIAQAIKPDNLTISIEIAGMGVQLGYNDPSKVQEVLDAIKAAHS